MRFIEILEEARRGAEYFMDEVRKYWDAQPSVSAIQYDLYEAQYVKIDERTARYYSSNTEDEDYTIDETTLAFARRGIYGAMALDTSLREKTSKKENIEFLEREMAQLDERMTFLEMLTNRCEELNRSLYPYEYVEGKELRVIAENVYSFIQKSEELDAEQDVDDLLFAYLVDGANTFEKEVFKSDESYHKIAEYFHQLTEAPSDETVIEDTEETTEASTGVLDEKEPEDSVSDSDTTEAPTEDVADATDIYADKNYAARSVDDLYDMVRAKLEDMFAFLSDDTIKGEIYEDLRIEKIETDNGYDLCVSLDNRTEMGEREQNYYYILTRTNPAADENDFYVKEFSTGGEDKRVYHLEMTDHAQRAVARNLNSFLDHVHEKYYGIITKEVIHRVSADVPTIETEEATAEADVTTGQAEEASTNAPDETETEVSVSDSDTENTHSIPFASNPIPVMWTEAPREYIDEALSYGTLFENGRIKVYQIIGDDVLSNKEKADKIKATYGICGFGQPLYTDGLHGYKTYGNKGLEVEYRHDGIDYVTSMTWNNVLHEIERLINEKRYLSDEETRAVQAHLSATESEDTPHTDIKETEAPSDEAAIEDTEETTEALTEGADEKQAAEESAPTNAITFVPTPRPSRRRRKRKDADIEGQLNLFDMNFDYPWEKEASTETTDEKETEDSVSDSDTVSVNKEELYADILGDNSYENVVDAIKKHCRILIEDQEPINTGSGGFEYYKAEYMPRMGKYILYGYGEVHNRDYSFTVDEPQKEFLRIHDFVESDDSAALADDILNYVQSHKLAVSATTTWSPDKKPSIFASNTDAVQILWSEHPAFYNAALADRFTSMSFPLANKLLGYLDEKQNRERNSNKHVGWYHKTSFRINYHFNGEPRTYEGRYDLYDLGDGEHSLVDHIRAFLAYYYKEDGDGYKIELKEAEKSGTAEEWKNDALDFYEEMTATLDALEKQEMSPYDEDMFERILQTEYDWQGTRLNDLASIEEAVEANAEILIDKIRTGGSKNTHSYEDRYHFRRFDGWDRWTCNDGEWNIPSEEILDTIKKNIGINDEGIFDESGDFRIIGIFEHRDNPQTDPLVPFQFKNRYIPLFDQASSLEEGGNYIVYDRETYDGIYDENAHTIRFHSYDEAKEYIETNDLNAAKEPSDHAVSDSDTPDIDMSDSITVGMTFEDATGATFTITRLSEQGIQFNGGERWFYDFESKRTIGDILDTFGDGARMLSSAEVITEDYEETEEATAYADATTDQEDEASEDDFLDVNPEIVRERLAEIGIENGEIVDEEKFNNSSFNRMVEETVREALSSEDEEPEQTDYTIDDYENEDVNTSFGSYADHVEANLEAIRTLKAIEARGNGFADATADEIEILHGYIGWGGLSDVFDERKERWNDTRNELRELLTESEYQAAMESVLTAHYTDGAIVHGIYTALYNMGFRSGNILEPSMGIGAFFAQMPQSMREQSNLTGIELDTITGHIAKAIHKDVNVKVMGFEKTDNSNFYDLAIGNVPFGNYGVNDTKFNKHNFSIHNYFFAKALDQLRVGGILAFVTSRYTLDSKNSSARKYLAERADLMGAIRLPNNAFSGTANTEVVSDIIFLKKREMPTTEIPSWTDLATTEDGLVMNSYFVEHPEMILGTPVMTSGRYGETLTVEPLEDGRLYERMTAAASHLVGDYEPMHSYAVRERKEREKNESKWETVVRQTVEADPNIPNNSYGIASDGNIYFRENSVMFPINETNKKQTQLERIREMIPLRDGLYALIAMEQNNAPDEIIDQAIAELNELYDAHVKQYNINSSAVKQSYGDDSAYFMLAALEKIDDEGNVYDKADILKKRVIVPETEIETVETARDALICSMRNKNGVDLGYMRWLLGGSATIDEITSELRGQIFKVPEAATNEDETVGWVTASEYLSGNVKEKLIKAQEVAQNNPLYDINVVALENVQPVDLEASEISVTLGATWIPIEYYQQFINHLMQNDGETDDNVEIEYSPISSSWKVIMPRSMRYSVLGKETWGTSRRDAGRIFEGCMNLKSLTVSDRVMVNGKKKDVVNQKETLLAQQKQLEMQRSFEDWIFEDMERRERLVRIYNDRFNNIVPREYDGSYLTFPNMSADIELQPHQKDAVARALLGGNTLLAHVVGAGKTFEMATIIMESKRLHLSNKALIVCPNHLVAQWASEFMTLYPTANILYAKESDFVMQKRRQLFSRIATNDYDAIIVGQSQFSKMSLSDERVLHNINSEIREAKEFYQNEVDENGERTHSAKDVAGYIKRLETKLEKHYDEIKKRHDELIPFETLGIDRLVVDEAHHYKNLETITKMSSIPGVNAQGSLRASDMLMKVRYIDSLSGSRNTVFATGTPVSNSMTEMYTMMRYLYQDKLKEYGFDNFDDWASTFGRVESNIELSPDGQKFQVKQRFSKFHNVPELLSIFKEFADVKTRDDLNLDIPEAEMVTVVAEPSEEQKAIVESLQERARRIHEGEVDATVDNMLVVTSDGKKLGIDQRILNPMLPDNPTSKVNKCIDNVVRIYEETMENRSTQMIFCDMSTPKLSKNEKKTGDDSFALLGESETFCIYDDIKEKLIARGIAAEEIAYIHEANTALQKQSLFEKVNAGKVRVLLGSTSKMGAGTNAQKRLIALHHLDAPWRPSDMEQREGRMIRQGNDNKHVTVYTYVTKGTFDAYLFQILKQKASYIAQIMTSKNPARTSEDTDAVVLNFAEIMAATVGDPRIQRKMELDVEIKMLSELRKTWQNSRRNLEEQVKVGLPDKIELYERLIAGCKEDIKTAEAHPKLATEDKSTPIMLNGKTYDVSTDKENALKQCIKDNSASFRETKVGEYRGFDLGLNFSLLTNTFIMTIRGENPHSIELGTSMSGNFVRMDNAIKNFSAELERLEGRLKTAKNDLSDAQKLLDKPFAREEEYQSIRKELDEINIELANDKDSPSDIPNQTEETPTDVIDDMDAEEYSVSESDTVCERPLAL